ncbi:lamin tail domain-containing protein [Haloarcula nitratireducens]|uniref:Lamin tail domain-containing protein n=1 Tax=Haloarcula nitratireducens TaxID=2487749 RepID=A0AAW4PF97_9EURY|nr:lamin tail domain-containing protein [Halomicroarcula nitratireducens]MBX0296338.1 lamin tail domain-containing protein [Halomicroarcula nitratireducens]
MRRLPLVALLALAVVLAGCGGFTVPAEQTPTERATVEQSPAERTVADPGGETAVGAPSAGPLPEETIEVTVTAVVDGDTIRVRYDNGTEDTVRLVGVDTPEVNAENDPAEFEGIPTTAAGTECLRGAGIDASNFAKTHLLGETAEIAFDPATERRGYYDRLLAYVVVDDRLFNYRLVATGHARVYDESPFTRKDRFLEAESAAREARLGLWQCVDPGSVDRSTPTVTASESGLVVAGVHADAEGNDNENLNGEYVVFANRGDDAISLSGWTVTDGADHRYTFGDYALAPGERVTLYTGSGSDTERERYWGASGAVWNNGGDTITVRDADGTVVLERSY